MEGWILKLKRYICVANCPELDKEKEMHCIKNVNSEEDYFNMLNSECPCGNYSKWEVDTNYTD